MRSMKRITLLAALFFGILNGLSAQEEKGWTLDACISYAMENNIALKRQELATELNKKEYVQSKLNLLPNLNGQAEHNMGSGRVLDQGTYEWRNSNVNQGDLGVVSNVTLFSGLRGYNNIKMQESGYLASRENLALYENNLLLQIMTGYVDLLRKEELFEIAVEKVRITEMQVERMNMLLEVGNASAGDLLEVKAQASAEKYNTTLARNLADVARLILVHLLNLSDQDSFAIVRPEIPDPSILQLPQIEEVYDAATGILPQIKSAGYTIEYYDKNLAVARGALSPELYLRALYYSNYSNKLVDSFNPTLEYSVPQQVVDNQYRQVSVGVRVPIFNKWQARTDISKAKIGAEDARYNLEDTKQQLYKDIQQYYTDARAALENYEAAGESNANSEEVYRYTEEKFKVGMATALELEEARNRMFASRAEMVSAKYVFVFYVKILDFYRGKDITF